jgi:hypothetical protein
VTDNKQGAGESGRHLVSIRRSIPESGHGEYDAAWQRVQHAATEQGAHAWRFVSATHTDLFLEFLEFEANRDPRREPVVAAALRDLDRRFPAPAPPADAVEEWTEMRE